MEANLYAEKYVKVHSMACKTVFRLSFTLIGAKTERVIYQKKKANLWDSAQSELNMLMISYIHFISHILN